MPSLALCRIGLSRFSIRALPPPWLDKVCIDQNNISDGLQIRALIVSKFKMARRSKKGVLQPRAARASTATPASTSSITASTASRLSTRTQLPAPVLQVCRSLRVHVSCACRLCVCTYVLHLCVYVCMCLWPSSIQTLRHHQHEAADKPLWRLQ